MLKLSELMVNKVSIEIGELVWQIVNKGPILKKIH